MEIYNKTTDKYGIKFNNVRRFHPDWFVINEKSDEEIMLHRARCPHFDFNIKVNLAANAKYCSENRRELEGWARQKQVKLQHCKTCL